LIDKKYELKREKAKTLTAAYGKPEGSLTDERKEKMKEVREEGK